MITRQFFRRCGAVTLAVAILLAAPALVRAQGEDTTPPVLKTFTFTPMSIDTTAGAQSVTLTAEITDDLSGFQSGCAYFQSPSLAQSHGVCFGSSNLTSGNALDGVYQGTISFPQYEAGGSWSISYVQVVDAAGNTRTYGPSDLSGLGFPNMLSVTSTPDTTPPVLKAFNFTPMSINTTAGAQSVTLTAEITDDLSGFQSGCAYFQSPSLAQSHGVCFGSSNRTSGNASDGVYQGTISFPQYGEAGTWSISYVQVIDAVGNTRTYGPSDLTGLTFPTALNVTSTPDTTPPVLKTFSFTPMSINTTAGAQSVTLTAETTDNSSGFQGGCAYFQSPSLAQSHGVCFNSSNRTSGNALDGVYQGTISFPQYDEEGQWSISYVQVIDAVGNTRTYGPSDLSGLGFPTTLQVGNTVSVTIASVPAGLSFSVSGTGCVPGSSYTTPQVLVWVPASSCTVTFTSPQAGTTGTQYVFSQWEDTTTNPSRMITAPASSAIYTATFNTQYLLTTSVSPSATFGSVTPASGQFYNSGTIVNLQATANSGYAFGTWTGSVAGSNSASTTVTMSGPETVTANFNVNATITSSPTGLSFSVTGTGCTTVSGAQFIPEIASHITPQVLSWTPGSSCTVTFGTPQAGAAGTQYAFSQWENGSTNASRMITAPSSPATYTATFNTQYQLTTLASPSATYGSVTPASGSFYNSGTVVNLQATANSGYAFSSWTGSVANSSNAATTVTMSGPETVTANFNVNATDSATFVGADKTTQGNWMQVYGADAYDIANGPQYPANGTAMNGGSAYGTYAVHSQSNWTWASSTSDKRALETDGQGDRIAATWYSGSSFSIDVNLTDGQQHAVALYLLDWDSQGRNESVTITDANNPGNPPLDKRTIADSSGDSANTNTTSTNFVNGTYLIWNISGHVTITVTRNTGPNSVVAGIFFGGASSSSSGGPPPSASATGFHTDTSTGGNWLGTYGGDGYDVSQAGLSLPSYDPTFAVLQENYWTWNPNPGAGATTALETGTDGTNSRIAATWYSSAGFSFDMNLADGNPHQVAFYAIDWDSQGRSEKIKIQDASSDATLDTETITNFTNGVYLIWTITGHVTITVTPMGGPNAVISGVFWGGTSVPAPSAAATWVKSDTTTQGAWMGKYGSSGDTLANAGQSFLIPATFSVQNSQTPWTWASNPNPPDPRDLETDNQGHQIAAAWYSPGSFDFDLNLTDGKQHQVTLYVLDWDNKGRTETIQISDANSNSTLDTRKIPDSSGDATATSTTGTNFVNGTYLIWNVTGHVIITITSNAGPNAVVSGMFID